MFGRVSTSKHIAVAHPKIVRPHSRTWTMLRKEYDLVVLGAGPTGLTAALEASAAGRSALIVDATPKRLVQFSGPTGLFSKALRDTAKKVDVGVLRNMGLRDTAVWRQVQEMTDDVLRASGLSNRKAIQLSSIPHLRGKASFLDANRVAVTFIDSDRKVEVQGKNILIATGSRPYRLQHIPYDEEVVFDSDTIKQLSFLPKSITIVGAGIIAIEYAKIFSKLDCKVTLVVRGKSLAAALVRIGIDDQIALELQKDLCLNKVRIVFEAEIDHVTKPDAAKEGEARMLTMTLKQPKGGAHRITSLRSQVLLTATGRSANTNELGLGNVGVDMDKDGNVKVDGQLRTTVPGIFAAGDVLGAPSLASTGIEQANAAVRTMFKIDSRVEQGWREEDASPGYDPRSLMSDPLQYPIGIWTLPEMAFIGASYRRAVEMKIGEEEGVGEAVAYYKDTIRGHVQNIRIGLLKLVYAKPSGRILAVHILGEDACELIHYGTALAQSGKTVYSVLGTMFAAVTFHELFKSAALKAVKTLETDTWLHVLDQIGVDDKGMMRFETLRPGLLQAQLAEGDVDEICNAVRCPGAPMVQRSLIMSQVSKHRPPR